MNACLHICIFAGLSLYPHVCIHLHVSYVFACMKKGVMSACLCEWQTGKKNALWVGASDGGLTCCTTLLADL